MNGRWVHLACVSVSGGWGRRSGLLTHGQDTGGHARCRPAWVACVRKTGEYRCAATSAFTVTATVD